MLGRRGKLLGSLEGSFFTYIHSNNKLGVMIELSVASGDKKNAAFQELGKNLAMQVAASNPICITRSEVPSLILEREKAIFREEIKGKPEKLVEKIVLGKLDKFFAANCLLEQPFIKDDKLSIKALLEQTAKTLNESIEIKQFTRFQVGETVSR